MKKIFMSLFILLSLNLMAQHNHVEHLSIFDTFLGSEDNYQVCFPKDHRNFFYAIFALTFTTAFFAILTIFNARKNNKILKSKNEIIESYNRDLVDSIKYSLKIQKSILPIDKTFKSIFSDSFIYYCPKDIVSGDFYWVFKNNQHSYVGVIDCTGHGVPGAFLSLIGNNALNKAVKEDGDADPSSILHKMNFYVKETLQQHIEDNALRDGMEVAICRYNNENGELVFSGANLNLLYFSEGSINIIKGSKCTVGSVQPHVKNPPSNQNIKLNKGDIFYLYSDGIVDQFGGDTVPEGEKFKLHRFIELLKDIAFMNTVEQQNKIELSMQNWKGKHPQLDDMCVIGIRV